MINPTISDIGRHVRYWTRWREEFLGIITAFDESAVWCLFGPDVTPRRVMRCMLTFIR